MRSRIRETTFDNYATELRRRLAGNLPLPRIEEAVDETRAHLEDLLDDPTRADIATETAAIRAYVPARILARGIARAWDPIFLRHRGTPWLQALGLAIGLCACFVLVAYESYDMWFVRLGLTGSRLLRALAGLAPVPVFLCALAACRPQTQRIVAIGTAFLTIATLLGGFAMVAFQNGHMERRANVHGGMLAARRRLPRIENDLRLVEAGLRVAEGPDGLRFHAWPEELRYWEVIVVPNTEKDHQSRPFAHRWYGGNWFSHATGDPARAVFRWKRDGRNWQLRLRGDRDNAFETIAENSDALAQPFCVPAAQRAAAAAFTCLGILALADSAGGSLGRALLRRRRRRSHHGPGPAVA